MSTMPVPRGERLDELPMLFNDHRAPGWWGMVGLIATEAMLFACLLASLYYLRATVGIDTAESHHPPKLVLPSIMTVLLVTSSLTLYWGEHGLKEGHRARYYFGAAATLLLGVGFLGVQIREYSLKPPPGTDAYHSVFFAITGTHGTHVLVGLLLIAVTLVRAAAGHIKKERHLAVRNVGMYWHFVDAVWLTIYTTVYLWPHLY